MCLQAEYPLPHSLKMCVQRDLRSALSAHRQPDGIVAIPIVCTHCACSGAVEAHCYVNV